MKSKRSRTYLVSGLTLALIFVAIILVFRDVLPDIVKDLSTVPFWGVLILLSLGFAYETMESMLCLVIIHHKKPDCTFIDALRVTFLGVFGNIATLGAGTLPMQSFYLYRRGLDAGSGLGIMASEYVLHKISVLIYATVALLLGGDWLEQSASGLARYLLIGYVIGALIVIALTLLYTWDKVLKLVLMLLASLMLLITSALPNVAGVGPMEFAFLLLFAPWADTAIASSALVLYRVATYFFPFLLSVIVFLREEKKSLKGFDAQSA